MTAVVLLPLLLLAQNPTALGQEKTTELTLYVQGMT
jgi:hypothetical protein